jgi:hypothetical protein
VIYITSDLVFASLKKAFIEKKAKAIVNQELRQYRRELRSVLDE